MGPKGFVVPPGQGPVWNMAPGRSATLKLQSGETAESMTMFEEVAPTGTVTNFHMHHDSDEAAYVLSGRSHHQDRRSGHRRRTGHMRLHTPRHCARLEEHRSRSRKNPFRLYASRGREGV